MPLTTPNVAIGRANFETYLSVVSFLHRPDSANIEQPDEEFILSCLAQGYKALRGILEEAGAKSARDTRNKLVAPDGWQEFVASVHDLAYSPARVEECRYPLDIVVLKPDPLLRPDPLGTFGRKQGFSFGVMMDGVRIHEAYRPTVERVDASLRAARRHGSATLHAVNS
ncbi:hypothetical protein KC930_00090 [Candidatus Saccharibacteria bacterium]|nr:hypothetical protein [Candidatus Saccharibacteria bacterium]